MKASITLLLSFLAMHLFASADICNWTIDKDFRGAVAHDDRVNLNLEYSTDEAGGVRIFVRPWTNGSATPGYGAHGSGLYTGDGTATGWFTVSSGEVTVDEIRVTVLNADQSELLREFWIPVHFEFGENGANDFLYSHWKEGASFLLSERAEVTFDYHCNTPGGCRIFVRPYTDGALTPGYSASGSPLLTGEGSHTTGFQINSGNNVRVDHLRVTVLNADQSVLFNEFYLPVNWYWSTVKIDGFGLDGPIYPANNQNVTVDFDYETSESAGVRIFPRPITNGGLSPNYGACGSPIFSGTGQNDCNFTITATNQRVDHIQFRATNPDQTETLLEMRFPINIFFGNFPLDDIVACPMAPARLQTGEPVNLSFTFDNNESGPARIFPRPFTDGSLSPGYGASGSPSYGTGDGQGAGFFTINNNGTVVDQVRFQVTSADQSETWASYFFDVRYTFGDLLPTSTFNPEAEQHLSWSLGPNPARELSQLRLRAEVSGTIQLQLHDLLGRRLWSQETQLVGGQEMNVELALSTLTPGTYYLRMQGAGYQAVEPLIVQ